jgi:endonuclease YncB( thermonuclease family)
MIDLYFAYLLNVIDGDTFKARIPVWQGVEIVTSVRINGIDAPEIKSKCDHEKTKAQQAKKALNEILKNATTINLQNVQDDKYSGRVVAEVFVDGKNLAAEMIRTNFARQYTGGTRASWCN